MASAMLVITTPNGDDDNDGVDNLADNCLSVANPLKQIPTTMASAMPVIPLPTVK